MITKNALKSDVKEHTVLKKKKDGQKRKSALDEIMEVSQIRSISTQYVRDVVIRTLTSV